jgi:hypothetical protein
MKLSKNRISIEGIGHQRFLFGLVSGLLTAICLSLFFNYSKEMLRFFTSMNADLLVLSKKEYHFYNYFYSALSSCLGLSITISIWMGNNKHKRKKDRLYKRQTQANILLYFWVTLSVISRFSSVLTFVLYGTIGYDNQLDFVNDYWLLFVLLPCVIFLQSWSTVRLVYRSTKWILYSFLSCSLLTLLLSFTTSIDQEKINTTYNLRYQTEFNYVDSELEYAKQKYNIEFNDSIKHILKKWYTKGSLKQVNQLKHSFSSNQKTTLKTIILSKIVLHNLKVSSLNWHPRNSIENWHYAFPDDIFKQIKKNDIKSDETKELFALLKLQSDIIFTPEINWENIDDYSAFDFKKNGYLYHQMPKGIKKQLYEVIMEINADSHYVDYQHLFLLTNNNNNNKRATTSSIFHRVFGSKLKE